MRTPAALLCWGLAFAVPLALVSPPNSPVPSAPPALAASLVALAPAGDGDEPANSDQLVEQVRKSIDDGVTYLRGRQKGGNWEVDPASRNFQGGWTSLALLALLNAGVKPTDKAVQDGLKYLRTIEPARTYTVGLQTMVFVQAGQRVDRERIQRNLNWLLAARQRDGWGYGKSGVTDNSNSQYALLGVHEAIQAGFKVDPKTMKEVQDLYVKTQVRGGGWGYRRGGGATMTMTTAGLCNLLIAGMNLHKGKATLRGDGSAERCGQYDENEPAADALRWIGGRFPPSLTRANAVDELGSPFYCLYGLERTGRLTGQRYFGGHDWYEVGCRYLVSAQRRDGSWEGGGGVGVNRGGMRGMDSSPVIATSFALLFLSKGRTPVLVSKLAYGGKDYEGWNNKRHDLRHLVEFASRELFKGQPLAWQSFDVRRKPADTAKERRALAAELLQSPVVFFSGHDFAPRDKEEEVLREYVNNGGFILVENCCGAERHPKFDKDFRALVKRLFPDAELQKLEADHPVWLASGKFASSPKLFPLEGVKQGCKTVLIYSPVPLAGYWEENRAADKGTGQKAFELGANILAYATGLEPPRPRLTQVTILDDGPADKGKRGYLKVAQLHHDGDWQPAPKAMRHLMAEARKAGLDALLDTAEVYPSGKKVLDYRFLYMHGRKEFAEKPEELKHLRFVLKNGGVLLADACCGSKAFDKSFRKFVAGLFAEDKLKLEPIPLTDELFAAELNGAAIERVRCRRLADDGKRVDPVYRVVPPQLYGVKYKGRWVVIYSPYDLGCALEKHTSPDCLGHDHASAVRLARAAVLYALKR